MIQKDKINVVQFYNKPKKIINSLNKIHIINHVF